MAMETNEEMEVSIVDVAMMLYHAVRASKDDKIGGWFDTDVSLTHILAKMSRPMRTNVRDMERLLYCSNLMNENKNWVHPKYDSFDEWVKAVMGPRFVFDKRFSIIERK